MLLKIVSVSLSFRTVTNLLKLLLQKWYFQIWRICSCQVHISNSSLRCIVNSKNSFLVLQCIVDSRFYFPVRRKHGSLRILWDNAVKTTLNETKPCMHWKKNQHVSQHHAQVFNAVHTAATFCEDLSSLTVVRAQVRASVQLRLTDEPRRRQCNQMFCIEFILSNHVLVILDIVYQ